jgi:hypothetical protein
VLLRLCLYKPYWYGKFLSQASQRHVRRPGFFGQSLSCRRIDCLCDRSKVLTQQCLHETDIP